MTQKTSKIEVPGTRHAAHAGTAGHAHPGETRTARRAATLDPDALDRIGALQRPGAPSVLQRITDIFARAVPPQLAALRDAVAGEEFNNIAEIAHSLRSSCASVGALEMVRLCQLLEDNAQAKVTTALDQGDHSDPVQLIAQEYDFVMLELRARPA